MLRISFKRIFIGFLLLCFPVSAFAIWPDGHYDSFYFHNPKSGEYRRISVTWDWWDGVLAETLSAHFYDKPTYSPFFKDWDYVWQSYYSLNYHTDDCETYISGKLVVVPQSSLDWNDAKSCKVPQLNGPLEIMDFGLLDFLLLSWLVFKRFSTFFLFWTSVAGTAAYFFWSALFKSDRKMTVRSVLVSLGLVEMFVVYELCTDHYFFDIVLFWLLALLVLFPFSIAWICLLLKNIGRWGFIDFAKSWIRRITGWTLGIGSFAWLVFSWNPPDSLTYFSVSVLLILPVAALGLSLRTKR